MKKSVTVRLILAKIMWSEVAYERHFLHTLGTGDLRVWRAFIENQSG